MAKNLKIGDIVKLPSSMKDRKHYRVVDFTFKFRQPILVPNKQKSNYEDRIIQFEGSLEKVS